MGSGLIWLRGDCPTNGERMDSVGRIRRGFVRACTVVKTRGVFRGSGRIRSYRWPRLEFQLLLTGQCAFPEMEIALGDSNVG